MAQTSVEQAIRRAAHHAGLSTDSWSVRLVVPYPHVTVYGSSLSAMVALSVLALAKGNEIPSDRVLTGGITPDGRIECVGAMRAHMRRILIPDEADPADEEWRTPFLVQVSPVHSVEEAYLALTGHALSP